MKQGIKLAGAVEKLRDQAQEQMRKALQQKEERARADARPQEKGGKAA